MAKRNPHDDEPVKKEVPFKQVLDALLDSIHPFPPYYLHRFSDLEGADLTNLERVWFNVNPERRAVIMNDLVELADADPMMSFESIASYALKDSDPRVRISAIRLLWDYPEIQTAKILREMLAKDPEESVRAAAAGGLGAYMYEGEVDEFDEAEFHLIEEDLLKTVRGSEPIEVRRRSLEALGYSSREDVPPLIQAAFESKEKSLKISALFAMGRSADEKRWGETVLKTLHDEEPEIQFEAVRAAGELSLSKAGEILLTMLKEDENLDDDVRDAAIWSLSQIGGEGVKELLEDLYENTDDDEELEFLSDALDNLEFTENFDPFGLLEIDGVNEDDLLLNQEDLEEEAEDQDEAKPQSRKRHKKTP